MNDSKVCRWGILSTAKIARKFWNAVRLADNATLVAVASRDAGRASEFIGECSARFSVDRLPEPMGDYAELLDRDDIDAIYVPLPTGVRAEWVIAAAERGKHVLCEKPCAVSIEPLRQMLDACRGAGIQFMDNVMFMHSRRMHELRKLLDDPKEFGQMRRIDAHFSFAALEDSFQQNIRSSRELEPLGCLGDLGWYCIRMAIWAMQGALPLRVSGRAIRSGKHGNPTEFSGELVFPGDVTAAIYCSFVTAPQQWVRLAGERGCLVLDDFVLPYFGSSNSFRLDQPQSNMSGFDFNFERHSRRIVCEEHGNGHESAQEVSLVHEFSRLVLSGETDSYWPEISMKTQVVASTMFESSRSGGQEIDCLS